MSRAEYDVDEALTRFYFVNHDESKLRGGLITLIRESCVRAFAETKKRIEHAITSRIDHLSKDDSFYTGVSASLERANELRALKNFVHGMVVKTDEST